MKMKHLFITALLLAGCSEKDPEQSAKDIHKIASQQEQSGMSEEVKR